MTDHYECAGCAKKFKTTDAVDGFSQGYKAGFLCPYCHVNLEENGQSDGFDNMAFGYSFWAFTLVLYYLMQGRSIVDWFEPSIANEISSFLVFWLPMCIAFLGYNRNAILKKRIVYTKKVAGRHNLEK